MFERVRVTIIDKLALDAVTRTSSTCPLGTTALDNESRYYPVEYEPIIETLLDKGNKVVDRIGGYIRIEFSLNNISIFHFYSHFWILIHDTALSSFNYGYYSRKHGEIYLAVAGAIYRVFDQRKRNKKRPWGYGLYRVGGLY
jgi:hypothetical protein